MAKAFNKAGNRIEKAVIAQISNWDNGDGFDTLNPACLLVLGRKLYLTTMMYNLK
ncbi:MAG: hypothetical protein R2788_00900 [Saprospiraceae bacterium]